MRIHKLICFLSLFLAFSIGFSQTAAKTTTPAKKTAAKKPVKKAPSKRVKQITIKTLELRKEPAVVSPSLATMKIGEKVTVLEEYDGKWVKVSYKGRGKNGKIGTFVGYMYKMYLSK